MCGLGLGLRDGHSRMARAATNTEAIVLSILNEAQRPEWAARAAAGPCPLRGMRKATVAGAAGPGVRLAATASLLLGAAKIRDHADDGEAGALRARPMARAGRKTVDRPGWLQWSRACCGVNPNCALNAAPKALSERKPLAWAICATVRSGEFSRSRRRA